MPRATRTRDPLTSLLSRAGLAEAVAGLDRSYAVALIDVDDFKAVNSCLGLAGGDSVLVQVASLLADSLEEDLVCRWGGEEFLIVMPGVTASTAAARAERLLRRSMAEIRVIARAVSFSCGFAASWPGATLEDVVRQADHGLRLAKAGGKARVCISDVQDLSSTDGRSS